MWHQRLRPVLRNQPASGSAGRSCRRPPRRSYRLRYPPALFESGALEIAPGIGGIVIMLGQGPPALRRLTLYIGLTGIPLSVERIELLLQAMPGGFAGVNGATEYFGFSGHRQRPGRGSTAAPRTADRSSWCR